MSRSRAKCGIRYRHLKPGTATTTDVKRDRVLLNLGFASYRDYLKSPLWKSIRNAKLAAVPNCEFCNCKAQCVHHLSYRHSTLKGNRPEQLVSLCHQCHHEVEFKADGTKRTYEAARGLTKRRLQELNLWEQHKKPKRYPGISPDRDA